ncbi:hypothetical protein M7I_5952 [Glarea lozoyensis 74030]|uniref:Adhesion defective protein 1 n=1 Tax=Glarea lozoyensis (strain ATCC 74030 / MF5533) TaxID=1104152 RepID=H0ET93_GLAL7|nr:hypothetical protein M7I_5952 [Glarea lozoyensis 74030]
MGVSGPGGPQWDTYAHAKWNEPDDPGAISSDERSWSNNGSAGELTATPPAATGRIAGSTYSGAAAAAAGTGSTSTQQMAIQQQANAQAHAGNGQGQQNQLSSQHIQSMQQAQMAQAQAQAQQAQHQQSAAAAAQQNQPPPSQPQPQPQPNPQAQPPVSSQQPQPQAPNNAQQQQAMAAARMAQIQQAQQGEKLRGQCLMKLMLFADHLSNFATNSKPLETYMANGAASRAAAQLTKQQEDLGYWMHFVSQFFSPKGVMRHSLWMLDENSNKQYEIPFSALPRYFHTHFESGVKSMQLITEKGTERALPNSGHYIESQKSTFVYWFDNGSQLVATGSLRAHFDSEHKIELLEFVTNNHEEYLPRAKAIEAFKPVHEWAKEWHKLNTAPEGKQSPELNKKKPKPMRSPPNPPPEIDIAHSKVKPNIGITTSVFRFFELAEVMGQMNLLFHYSHQHSSLTPSALLEHYPVDRHI